MTTKEQIDNALKRTNSLSAFSGGVISMGRDAYNQGKNAQFDMTVSDNGIAQTCIAKGPGAVAYGLGIQSSSGIGACMENKSPSLIIGDNPGYQNGVMQACYWDVGQKAGTMTAHNAGGSQRMPDKENFNCVVQGVDLTNLNESDVNGSLQASAEHNIHSNNVARTDYVVRRLTPLECERLQGYPDGWTDIGEWTDAKGKKHETTDSARYKALGNSIALPQWRYVLGNICNEIGHEATMASLFDGIGGFPLIWEQLNGKGTCIWASEIEEFPIAVTERRINNDNGSNHGSYVQADANEAN